MLLSGHHTVASGRIVRMCLFTTNHKNVSIMVRISNKNRYILRKGNSTSIADNVSIDFGFGDSIFLSVLEGREHIRGNGYITLLIELDM